MSGIEKFIVSDMENMANVRAMSRVEIVFSGATTTLVDMINLKLFIRGADAKHSNKY